MRSKSKDQLALLERGIEQLLSEQAPEYEVTDELREHSHKLLGVLFGGVDPAEAFAGDPEAIEFARQLVLDVASGAGTWPTVCGDPLFVRVPDASAPTAEITLA